MRLVKLSDLSEEERKKALEEQQERLNKNRQEAQNIQKQANNDFNNYVQKYGAYDTNKHTTSIGNIKKAYKNTSSYNTVKNSLNNYYNNKNTSIWNDVKSTFNNLMLSGKQGVLQMFKGAETQLESNKNYKMRNQEQFYTSSKVSEFAKNQAKTEDNNILNNMMNNKVNIDKEKNNIKDKTQLFNINDSKIDNEVTKYKNSISDGKVDTNLTRNVLQNNIDKTSEKIQENTNNINNEFLKKANEQVVPALGQMGAGMIASAINPALGTLYFTESAVGSYYDDAKQRGMSDSEARKYSTIMGAMEGATEQIGIGNIKKAGKGVKALVKGTGKEVIKEGTEQITKTTLKSVLKDYGIGIADNVIQEALIDPIQELTAQTIAGKDKAQWEGIGQKMLQDGINGGLVSAILGGANLGIQSCTGVVEKVKNNKQFTQQEVQMAVQDASKKLDVGQMITDSTQQQINKYKDYYTGKTLDNNTQNILNQAQNIINNNTTQNLQQNATQNQTKQQTQQITPVQNENVSNLNIIADNLKDNAINEINTKQQNDILNNKELPMQSYQYEKSDNVKINNLRQDANKYFNNSEKARNYVNMLEKIITDKDVEIRLDADLKTTDGKIANGSYSNGVITINPNSTRTGEFIAIHELTHAIGTDSMKNIVEKYRKSNPEFNTAVEKLLQNYNSTEITEEAMSDISAQLFGNQEFINNIAQNNPNIFQKLYSEIKYLWHQFRGYKNQDQFVEDLYYKWTQAYNNNNQLNNTTNYYIETVADFNEMEYNNSKEIRLPKQEYAILSGIVNSDSNIKPGINYVETTNATYEVYYKETGEFKVLGKEVSEDYYDTITNGNIQGTGSTRDAESRMQAHSPTVQQSRTGTRNDEISDFNKRRTRISDTSIKNGTSNSNNVKYSIQESENNSGSFSVQDNKGRNLSKEQQEYFKNSKVKDDNGQLITVYHASQNDFTTFDKTKIRTGITMYSNNGDGFYFTDSKDLVEDYAKENGKVYETYLNIINPLIVENNISNETNKILTEFSKRMYAKHKKDIDKVAFGKYEIFNAENDIGKQSGSAILSRVVDKYGDEFTEFLKSKGYDGIKASVTDYFNTGAKFDYIAFEPNQIKNIDNTNPTDNPDIRFSQNNETWQQYIDKNYKPTGTRTSLKEVRLPTKEDVNKKLNFPTKETINQSTQGEKIDWNEIERPEGKIRKHYRSIIESSNTTKEAKAIAKELMGIDTYVPETNKGQLAQADYRISNSSPEAELKSLMNRTIQGEKISSVDIAVGERLIQYYSKIGDKTNLQEAIQTTAMAGTSAGQTVQALAMLNHQTPEGQATWIQRSVDKMNNELAKRKGGTITKDEEGNIKVVNKKGQDITDKVDLFELTPDMIDKIVSSKNKTEMYNNIDQVYEDLGQQVPLSTMEKIDSWRYFSMLANPKTHIRNIVGNFAMGKTQSLKDKLAGGIEDIIGTFNKDMERTKTLRPADAKTKEFAKNDVLNPDVQSMMELNENKYNPQSRLQNARKTFKNDALENTLGRLFNWNDKLLEAEDALGLKSNYKKALANYLTANKIDVDNITDKQLSKARNYAVGQAKEATFHQANAIATAINQFSKKNGLTKGFTDAVLPFVKTPLNVAKTGLEYNPTGLLKTITYDTVKLRKGEITVNKYIDNLSKGLTGTGIAVLGYALADAGILKASGGDDDKKEKYDEALGKQTYSITIGDITYSLDWLAPVGIPLFVGAEAKAMKDSNKEEKSSTSSDDDKRFNKAVSSLENLANAMANSMSPMSEMSMISGLTSALKSYEQDSTKMLGTIGTNAVKSYVNQFVPTLLGQVARTTDDYERSTTSTKSGVLSKAIDQTKLQVMSKIPGLRQKLPTKADIWGNEQKSEPNLPLRIVNNFVNPATVKNIDTSKVDEELDNLYNRIGESSILPSTIEKTYTINSQTYRMTNEEYAKYKKNYGQTSYKLLDDLINSNDYNKLSDEQKQKAIENIYSYAKEVNKVDYAKNNNETVKTSTLYDTLEELKQKGGNQSSYLNYIAKTKDITGEDSSKKKIEVLAKSTYTDKTKEIIYKNTEGSKDKKIIVVDKLGLPINEYLKYKSQKFESDKDEDGETVKGSKNQKVYDYLNNIPDEDLSQDYKKIICKMSGINSYDKDIVNMINNNKKLTVNERTEILTNIGFKIDKQGRIQTSSVLPLVKYVK